MTEIEFILTSQIVVIICTCILDGWLFMVLNATFNNISVILWHPFYWWRKLEYQRKTLTCRKSLPNFIT